MRTIDKIAKCFEQDRQRSWMVEFERRTKGLEAISCGLCSQCSDCQSTFDESEIGLERLIDKGLCDEGGFSRSGCDTCGNCLGQNLYAGHALIQLDGKQVLTHLEICQDCLMYIANGQLPGESC
jgi:hypothetical protein